MTLTQSEVTVLTLSTSLNWWSDGNLCFIVDSEMMTARVDLVGGLEEEEEEEEEKEEKG